MKPKMTIADSLRRRVLTALALNRTPGYHFPVHFLQVSFDAVARERTLLSIDPGEHCLDARGEVHLGATAVIADLAMSASIRAGLDPAQRLGTVTMSMHLHKAPRAERLEVEAVFQGFIENIRGRQGVSRYEIRSGGESIGFGGGSFMVLDPPPGVTMHPVRLRKRDEALPPPLVESDLDARERDVLVRAEAAAQRGGAFIDAFWGAADRIENRAHIANRVGHVQGGLMIGIAAASAAAKLGPSWRVAALTASFVSAAAGENLICESGVVHRGGLTALVQTAIRRADERLAFELISQHAAAE